MTVDVGYSGQARAAAGAAREELDLPAGATAADLIAEIARRHGERMAAVAHAVLIFVGDEQVDRATPLKDRDRVMLVSPISGG